MIVTLPVPGDRASISSALAGLTALDRSIIRAHPEVPTVYESGARWRAEDGSERWRSIADIYGFDPRISGRVNARKPVGRIDCEDLAAWRAADLQEREGETGAYADVVPGGLGLWHAIVQRADGSVEDVSARLGMPGRSAEVGAMAGSIEWSVRPLRGGGYEGSIVVPDIRFGREADGSITVRATGRTEAEAVSRAAALAGLSTAHPALRGMMPRTTPDKVQTIGRVARLARTRPGVLAGIAPKLSPGMRDLAEGLCS